VWRWWGVTFPNSAPPPIPFQFRCSPPTERKSEPRSEQTHEWRVANSDQAIYCSLVDLVFMVCFGMRVICRKWCALNFYAILKCVGLALNGNCGSVRSVGHKVQRQEQHASHPSIIFSSHVLSYGPEAIYISFPLFLLYTIPHLDFKYRVVTKTKANHSFSIVIVEECNLTAFTFALTSLKYML